jgi:hypothetical protein
LVAYDSHSTNDGTLAGPTVNQTGKLGKCYSFDGINDYISIPSEISNWKSTYTHSAWVKVTSFADYPDVVAFGNTSDNQPRVNSGFNTNGKMKIYFRTSDMTTQHIQ